MYTFLVVLTDACWSNFLASSALSMSDVVLALRLCSVNFTVNAVCFSALAAFTVKRWPAVIFPLKRI